MVTLKPGDFNPFSSEADEAAEAENIRTIQELHCYAATGFAKPQTEERPVSGGAFGDTYATN